MAEPFCALLLINSVLVNVPVPLLYIAPPFPFVDELLSKEVPSAIFNVPVPL